MDDRDPTVDAVVDYCRTQARLLSGQAETLSTEIDALLDEIDAEAAAIRQRLDGRQEHADTPERPTKPGESADADAVADLEARQATVAEKQARLDEIQSLSADYLELVETLRSDDPDVNDAIASVLEFEADAGAPAFFDDRETLLETATDQ